MFVTSPAGAEKSTVIKIAQQFCFEFCRSLDIIWGDKHFCSLQLLDVQLHIAAFLNSKSKNISDDMMRIWDQVRMLIIDEILIFNRRSNEQIEHPFQSCKTKAIQWK